MRLVETSQRYPWVSVIVVVLFTTLTFGPIGPLYPDVFRDWDWHIAKALEIKVTGSLEGLPHFLYHITVIGISEIFPSIAPRLQGGIPVLLFAQGLSLLTFELVRRQAINAGISSRYMPVALTIILITVAPILVAGNNFAYLFPTVYHSPTQIVLRFWVLPVTLVALRALNPRPYGSGRRQLMFIVLAVTLMILMTLTKPNYTLSLLPALGLIGLYRIIRRQPLDWPLLLGLGVTGTVLLGLQFFSTYNAPDESRIMFGVFRFMSLQTSTGFVILQFFASIAFPLYVAIAFRAQAKKDPLLNLTWVIFLISAVFAYFVHETRPRLYHGNFTWGAYVSLFVLFVASILFLIREHPRILDIKRLPSLRVLGLKSTIALILLTLHIVSAIYYWLDLVNRSISAAMP
jgi:hypothetical protein